AAAVAAAECGHTARGEDITVRLRGGELKILYKEDGTVLMTGPARFVFDGEII
ncbi:MAG TPA: diaminopimelate epimerase, partial [Ruminococcaceae bacterium]|nr:diaminopimelate epimerase [Oscillospiraceae bacterium]